MLHFTPFPFPFPSHPIVQSRSSASVAIITFLVVATADTRMPFGSPFSSLFYFEKALLCNAIFAHDASIVARSHG